MKTYNISIKELLERVIEVNATSESDAIDKVKEMYNNEDIVLDSSDFVEVDFNNLESE